ncbi:MAG: hypothetical protein AMJ93_06695 [Anaerolineae bacterium SM23_84]|nr:MAG: hypothetical protein AMJ93_06695 [Anaerolineae bacterium SM23_84]
MKERILFYRPDCCTGCLLCEMACSLCLSGSCQQSASLIWVLTHPRLGTSIPVVRERCLFTNCDERCTEACSIGVIRFAPEEDWPGLLADDAWSPVAVLPDADGG